MWARCACVFRLRGFISMARQRQERNAMFTAFWSKATTPTLLQLEWALLTSHKKDPAWVIKPNSHSDDNQPLLREKPDTKSQRHRSKPKAKKAKHHREIFYCSEKQFRPGWTALIMCFVKKASPTFPWIFRSCSQTEEGVLVCTLRFQASGPFGEWQLHLHLLCCYTFAESLWSASGVMCPILS